ncbi:MAG TPA: DNA recombination protein RmuC [bacterium]|nr:DNA recombination protein RmuC [bacterium]
MTFLIALTVLVLAAQLALLYFSLSRRGGHAGDFEKLERVLREEMGRNREESRRVAQDNRGEMGQQLQALTQQSEQRLERMRETVESRLKALQEENGNRLDQMRQVVDEKLQSTLERRLGESFKLVSERLEQVHQGLGEMQSLASNVGDLKKVLTNVKTRGTWGEVQLESLLQQVLTPDQYAKNLPTKKESNDRVEFAIRLPGKDEAVWLPVDAKFPQEDYQRLVEAQEQGRPEAVEEAMKSLENRLKLEARQIKEKYLDPPHTTDFGLMFLPTEGLYAEAARRPGLLDHLQREYRVVASGPTTFAALLNSLQMGFKTLAIEKRSSEVWELLSAIKQEFSKFGNLLDKTHKKLQEASHTIEDAAKKTRTIEKKLKKVERDPGPALESGEEERGEDPQLELED